MRILHTADWHLGRLFYGCHLTEDQAYIMEHQFFPLLKEANVDAIIIAGDIYDRSVPPVEAVELWDTVITKVASDYKIPLLVIGGNHDSKERLNFGRHLLRKQGIYMDTSCTPSVSPIILEDTYGPVYFCPMPFSDVAHFKHAYHNEAIQSLDEAYAIASQYLLEKVPKKARKVAMAHAFVTGGEESSSERPLMLGGSEQIHKGIFKDYHYTALGHLHGPQEFEGQIRYSGSLLKYSFDEYRQHKSFSLVDLDGAGKVSIESIPIAARRDVRVVEGSFDEILDGDILKQQIEKGCSLDDYLLARLTDKVPIIDGLARLRRRYPHILSIELAGRMEKMETSEVQQYKNLNERELFAQFAKHVMGDELTDEQVAYMDNVWARVIKEDLE